MTVHEPQGSSAQSGLRTNGGSGAASTNAAWGPPSSDLAWTVLLLGGEATCIALGIWSWLHSDALLEWVRQNRIGKAADRKSVV